MQQPNPTEAHARPTLRLAQAQRAVAALLDASEGYGMAIVVVDERGDVICSARMDGAPVRAIRLAMRKAYTAAVMGKDTADFKKQLEQGGRTLADYGEPLFTTLHGGSVVLVHGEVVGAIGIAGNSPANDDKFAHIARAAMGL